METHPAGVLRIDTGVARFVLASDGLLIREAQLVAGRSVNTLWEDGGAYLVDNRGRLARNAKWTSAPKRCWMGT